MLMLRAAQWFPPQYYGDGVDGHRYHVFDTVRVSPSHSGGW
jgi:hypothetical protein